MIPFVLWTDCFVGLQWSVIILWRLLYNSECITYCIGHDAHLINDEALMNLFTHDVTLSNPDVSGWLASGWLVSEWVVSEVVSE